MKYIGKIWLDKLMSMDELAEMLGLDGIVTFQTDDVCGTMKWRGGNILILIHLSVGYINRAEKVRIFAHHLDITEEGDFWTLAREKLKDVAKSF